MIYATIEQRIEPDADTMTKDETIRLQAAEIERLRNELSACATRPVRSLQPLCDDSEWTTSG